MGVAKQFTVFGQRRFEVRAEAFNITNTPAFNLPGSLDYRDARNFASITTMRNTPAVSVGREDSTGSNAGSEGAHRLPV
jgi:hypothetical protein